MDSAVGAFFASNNGLTVRWHDAAEKYQPQPGEIAFATYPAPADLAAAFPGYAAAAAAAIAIAKPAPTPRQWLERLQPSTQAVIVKAAIADNSGAVLLWLLKAAGNQSIDVTLPVTIAGVNAMQSAGLITAAEAAILLAP